MTFIYRASDSKMSVPSMVHRSGDSLVVRSVVSGDALFGTAVAEDADDGEELAEIVAAEDLPECKIKRNYSCPNCDYFTQNPRNFLYHLRDVHKEKVKIYECPNCLYASKHYQKLLRHAKMVHGSADGIELPRGKKRNIEDSEQELDDSENDDEETKFKCSHCTFTSKSQNAVNKHEKDEHLTKIKSKFFKCSKCSYTTPIKARFTKHTKYHSMPMIKCDLCDFKTPYKWNLDRHCKNHNGTGIYRCSACNFTADIKQSLTVHEMNHHVPPVGQAAAGIGVGKRRNKVGASDTMANEEGSPQQVESTTTTTSTSNITVETSKKSSKKSKPATDHHQSRQANAYGSDFINPEDIIHHANGQIYIKNKCKLCNYKSAWDGEMAKHEEKVHNIVRNNNNNNIFRSEKKKTSKPLPNLIPLHQPSKVPQQFCQPTNMSTLPIPPEPIYSQKDINDICAKSINSDLKDFASLIDSDVFKNVHLELSTPPKIPDLIPTSSFSKKKSKNSSFFDKFKANLTAENLRCNHCGHESKCLTELDAHKKICGNKARPYNTSSPIPRHNLSSTRCQFCRQRCKSSTDLINHLKTCGEAAKSLRESEDLKDEDENNPMENRIFVWNNIQVPMDIDIQGEDVNEDIQYEYIEEKQDDNISLDLSIRTQSPNSENSFLSIEPSNPTPTPSTTPTTNVATPSSTTTEKIPTHGNDISIAQHKRVFKCPHCTFWASTASRFHVHIVGHLNKKPFECSLCSYRSNWRWDITKHIKLKSVRDPAHESAKVLMTDETGRRNYTKYNKYLTEINVGGDNETSGGSGTRPKSSSNHHHDQSSPSQVLPNNNQKDVSRLNHHHRTSSNNSSFFNNNDFNNVAQQQQKTTRPVPSLKVRSAADLYKYGNDKKKNGSENKKTLWQCKKCNFRDPSKEKLLAHVKTHYVTSSSSTLNDGEKSVVDQHHQQQSPTNHQQPNPADHQQLDEASVGGGYSRLQAPFRCGHCQQVSNWKHVIQRHCRLKHSGDIRVVIGSKNGPDKIEVEDGQQEDEDSILPQEIEIDELDKNETQVTSCSLCNYHVANRNEYIEHLRLHGISDPEDYLNNKNERIPDSGEIPKRYQCTICPYDTNSKSQFSYHKQFHNHQGYQYTCKTCGYNVSKRHLLHQHMKVHGSNNFKQQNGGDNSDDGILVEFEEVEQYGGDIPLVWVSKNGKFAKMYKCRYCPHVNLRKVNIQDHEKMHGNREKNSMKSSNSEIEHRCPDCNYVCNNAGVLSSHSKVHQGLYGKIHGLVDSKRSDEEQIKEIKEMFGGNSNKYDSDEEMMGLVIDFNEENQPENNFESSSSVLYFCDKCPARFLKENEFLIHLKFHGARLIYKCDHCSYTARQQPHILAHNNVHSDEYQKRTAIFKGTYCPHPDYQPPKVFRKEFGGEFINIALENNDLNNKLSHIDMENEPECSIALNKTMKFTQNIPLSGTELFQQKNEAQLNYSSSNQSSSHNLAIPSSSRSDPQFGSLIHGNPDFIYPTCIKNGKTKEKRYKCHKCPSAFEKREQYKIHLGLHGAKSKYNCSKCDYSVKYYANYTQHIKKHQMNDEAVLKKSPEEDKKFFYCTNCPYSNQRKDSLDNHMKKHGSNNAYTCEHCDYSVPQAHVLRDHTKLHFAEKQKGVQIDGYMVCDNIKLTSKKLNQSDDDDEDEKEIDDDDENNDSSSNSEESIVFDEKMLDDTNLEGGGNNSNNNKGERVFVNPDTGEFAVDLSKVNETTANESNVDSQVSSDN
ncbi:uncharacterized protein [Onthophagus taurus]|uniref:uncharacterized protein isoform X1 n=2 Tax=Onthophagus taurus TaxID=166361 RepID=UPI0039BEBA51